jgi:hypothetical protein
MKANYKKIATHIPAVLLTAALASCGGGGGGGSGLTYQSAVTTPPSDPYSSDESLVFNQLSAIRPAAGYLTPNTALNTAATGHVNFLFNNDLLNATIHPGYLTYNFGGTLGGHYENNPISYNSNTFSTTGATGTTPQARATAAGYTGTVTELMTFGATDGTNCVDLLGDSVYHLVDLVSPFIDLGIAYNAGGGNNSSACAIEVGVKTNTLGQLPASGQVVYPYDTQTGVLATFNNTAEQPDPAPDLTAALQTPLGHPIIVSLYSLTYPTLKGSDIAISEFSITPSVAAGVRILANTGVTYPGLVAPDELKTDNVIPGAGFVELLPKEPLAATTAYTVTFTAMVRGNPVTKTWTFTTQ